MKFDDSTKGWHIFPEKVIELFVMTAIQVEVDELKEMSFKMTAE